MKAGQLTDRMGLFSVAYLEAVSAAAGVGIASMTPDINGVDARLESKDDGANPGFALNIQLKSSMTSPARDGSRRRRFVKGFAKPS